MQLLVVTGSTCRCQRCVRQVVVRALISVVNRGELYRVVRGGDA